MSSDGNFNFGPINIQGGQNVLGKNEGGMHQSTGNEPTLPTFIAKVVESLPVEIAAEIQPQIQTFAAMAPAEQTAAIESSDPRWLGIAEHIQPHAPAIWTNVATFGAAALQAFASRNPIVAGILAVCETHKNKPGTA